MRHTTPLLAERNRYEEQLTKLDNVDDPLGIFDRYLQWMLESFSEEELPEVGLVDLLDRASRTFKDDADYKSDPRYFKIWRLYASQVGAPERVYEHLMANGIGAPFSQLYEEYALLLESQGRTQEARSVYLVGINRPCRALSHLKTCYEEFQKRTSAQSKSIPFKQLDFNIKRSGTPNGTSSSHSAASSSRNDPYAHMRNEIAHPTGKKPEKYRFDMSLIFRDGIEYSIHEARAKSLGLLDKKWAPLRADTALKTRRNSKPSGSRSSLDGLTTNMTVALIGEPTMTYNSKQAMKDVFGMFNSPEKTMRSYAAVGSKHAPVKKIEAPKAEFKPSHSQTTTSSPEVAPKTPVVFRPYVDEEKKENATPALKFKPFVDENTKDISNSKTPRLTPGTHRQALSMKPTSTPVAQSESVQQIRIDQPTISTNDSSEKNLYPRVFTPIVPNDGSPQGMQRSLHIDVFRDDAADIPEPLGSENAGIARGATPFVVFSHPTTLSDCDDANPIQDPEPIFSQSEQLERQAPVFTPFREQAYLDAQDDNIVQIPRPAPMGGRFGQFTVMTPITERTFEYTTSTKAFGTPGEKSPVFDKCFMEREAVESAERLAAELREEEEKQRATNDQNALGQLIKQTETLSLTIGNEPTKMANPCNPTDPQVVMWMLSLIPADTRFYDLRNEDAHNLANLQRFVSKGGRRTSSNTTMSESNDTMILDLCGRNFQIVGKLGEGGFGTVFLARYSDEEDDEDDENLFALKVVKPRNLWEYRILRKIHECVPEVLQSSIITPYALYAYRDESYLLLDFGRQGTLLDIVNNAGSAGICQPGACLDELLVFFFTIELLRFLEGMHGCGFIHGDFKIDNCLLRLEDVPEGSSAWSGTYQPSGEGGWKYKGLKIIDFGRTIDTGLFPEEQQFVGDWEADAKDCFELRENLPWTYQTDYFGLAGIIHCMLFGKYFDYGTVVVDVESPRHLRVSTPFKRYWQVDLWSRLFDVLLNPCLVREDSSLPLCDELALLRTEMEVWLQANCNRSTNTLKGLLKKVEKTVLDN